MQKRIDILVILIGLQFVASAQVQSDVCEVLSTVELGVIGKSNIPIYGRGFGPGRRWMVGLNDRIRWFDDRLWLEVNGRVWGGAYYDNPDALEGGFGIHYNHRVGNKAKQRYSMFRVGIANWNQFSLNNHPMEDPAARRRTSNINYTQVQISRDMRFKGGCVVTTFGIGLRGNLPVWHPTAITMPYVNRTYAVEYRRNFRKWRIEPKINAYKAQGLRGRIEVKPVLLRSIGLWDHDLWVFVDPTFNINVGVPHTAQKIPDTRGVVFGLRIPIR